MSKYLNFGQLWAKQEILTSFKEVIEFSRSYIPKYSSVVMVLNKRTNVIVVSFVHPDNQQKSHPYHNMLGNNKAFIAGGGYMRNSNDEILKRNTLY